MKETRKSMADELVMRDRAVRWMSEILMNFFEDLICVIFIWEKNCNVI